MKLDELKYRGNKMIKWIKDNWKIILVFLLFESVAISLYVFTKNIFYLYNFTYIGTCVTVGGYLFANKIYFNAFILFIF